ncbi:hypothetical protein GCM10010402_12020 [Actinomadura luteofluorescens]
MDPVYFGDVYAKGTDCVKQGFVISFFYCIHRPSDQGAHFLILGKGCTNLGEAFPQQDSGESGL